MFVPELRISCKIDFLIDSNVYNYYNKVNFSFVLGRIINNLLLVSDPVVNHDCFLSDVVDNYVGNLHPHYCRSFKISIFSKGK